MLAVNNHHIDFEKLRSLQKSSIGMEIIFFKVLYPKGKRDRITKTPCLIPLSLINMISIFKAFGKITKKFKIVTTLFFILTKKSFSYPMFAAIVS